MKYKFENNNVIITDVVDFSLKDTLDCGQCFRWDANEEGIYHGVAFGKSLDIFQNENTITLFNTTKDDFYNIWYNYFDLDTDYHKIKEEFSADDTLKKAVQYAPGIRVLHQGGWETLLSFIISQNNNVKRIKGIIKTMCERYGRPLGNGDFDFPTAKVLATLSVDEIFELKCGFRAKYISDCAKKVDSGEINIDEILALDTQSAKEKLITIKGVGEKVADCTLLYGFGKMDCFPKDVWIKRAMANLFPEGLPECAKNNAGIAQQYIFHYARTSNIFD
ncbi:MAG: DNA glycosylase [Oscillospiraceae bacterium]